MKTENSHLLFLCEKVGAIDMQLRTLPSEEVYPLSISREADEGRYLQEEACLSLKFLLLSMYVV